MAPHKTKRQRGEGSRPVGNSRSKNATMRNQPIPRAHVPNHTIHAPAGSAPGAVISAYTAYCSPSSPSIQTMAPAQKSQPIGFPGRREATRAPTVEKARSSSERATMSRKDEEGELSTVRTSVIAIASTVKTHTPHPSQAARMPIRPSARNSSLAHLAQHHSTALPSQKCYEKRYRRSLREHT